MIRQQLGHFQLGPFESDPLTQREQEILPLLRAHLADKEIADQLGVSIFTIRTQLHRLYHKLHVHNRMEAVLKSANCRFSSPAKPQ